MPALSEAPDIDTSPVILGPDDDPVAALRTMAKLMPDMGRRGIAEIRRRRDRLLIGLAALTPRPEHDPLPLFDTRTREVSFGMLADWLKARGFEASAARWTRNVGMSPQMGNSTIMTFVLTASEGRIPPLPSLANQGAGYFFDDDAAARSGWRLPLENDTFAHDLDRVAGKVFSLFRGKKWTT